MNIIKLIEDKESTNTIIIAILSKLRSDYNLVRSNNREVKNLINKYTILINDMFNFEMEGHIQNRMISIISFKNDIKLQNELTKNNIDIYLQEINFIINKKTYKKDIGTLFKIIETIAKIQYAYNLINDSTSVYELYESLLYELYSNKNSSLKYFHGSPIGAEHYKLATIYTYFILFHNVKTSYEYIYGMRTILLTWKLPKINFYELDLKQVEEELNSTNYDLIY